MSTLIKIFEIPAEVRKQAYKYTTLELYDDKMVGKGGKNGDITWYFREYMTVQWTPASIATQFAQFIFTTKETGVGRMIGNGNLSNIVDINKIPFCSGMFSYAPANDYCKNLYLEVKEVFDEYKAKESDTSANNSAVQEVSSADEILKYKGLLDQGIITQEEFDAKKKQLLGL